MFDYGSPRYLKKNGRYLAYKEQINEDDYWDVSAITAQHLVNWYWTDDADKAKVFSNEREADVFLAKKRGEFWKGVEIVKALI
jgi:hypothetical protein